MIIFIIIQPDDNIIIIQPDCVPHMRTAIADFEAGNFHMKHFGISTGFCVKTGNSSQVLPLHYSVHGCLSALTIRPPTNQPYDSSTHTIRPPNKLSAVTIYYCDILPPIQFVQVFFVHPGFKADGLSHVT